MNQELKQRLIGAVVVTALAAIFIPMLFDDPVDNSGQSVSELVIPETPVNTGEESANKLPTSANQVLNVPDAGSETVVNTDEEAELSSNIQQPSDEPLGNEPMDDTEEGFEQPGGEPATDLSAKSLNTGIADETNKPVKIKKTLPEAQLSKQKSISKPPVEDAIDVSKKPVKKTETTTNKQPAKEKPSTSAAVNKNEKSSSELKRWSIQAGTFSKKENAVSRLETLRKLGLPVTMETTNGGFYRLKVGTSLDRKRASEMKAKLDSHKIQSIMIAE